MFAKRRTPIMIQLGGAGLLLAYLVVFFLSTVPLEVLHHHEDSSELHTQEAEEDGCHRTLYHAERNNGCDHREHFLVHETSCELCDALVPSLLVFNLKTHKLSIPKWMALHEEVLLSNASSELFLSFPPRGPPFWI